MKSFSLLLLVFMMLFCNFRDPKEAFAAKRQIGVCQENQGMVTYEAQLFSDSTFYIAGDSGFIEYSFGKFQIRKDTVYFQTGGGEIYLCGQYIYNRELHTLKPLQCPEHSHPEDLYLYFEQ